MHILARKAKKDIALSFTK